MNRTDLLNKDVSYLRKNYRICDDHFTTEHKYVGHRVKCSLKRDAVPTVGNVNI